jgi:cyclopropane-fatty-acyl-phospholipid synthase
MVRTRSQLLSARGNRSAASVRICGCREVDFIQRYVFPGGMLPSPQVLKSLGERFDIPVIRERIFGQDYARTLAIWRSNFRAAWPNLMPSGFDDRFRRLWEYYLAYCEAGFLSGNIDVRQVVFAKPK